MAPAYPPCVNSLLSYLEAEDTVVRKEHSLLIRDAVKSQLEYHEFEDGDHMLYAEESEIWQRSQKFLQQTVLRKL